MSDRIQQKDKDIETRRAIQKQVQSTIIGFAAVNLPEARARWVSPLGNDLTGTGSAVNPYQTIQKGIDDIEANLSPTGDNPGSVILYPGVYTAAGKIFLDGVHLIGTGGQGTCVIKPATGACLYITNATKASLEAFILSGTYSDLLARAPTTAGPKGTQIKNIDFKTNSNEDAIQLLGVKGDAGANTTDFGGDEINFMNCTSRPDGTGRSLFARNTNFIALQAAAFFTKLVECFNCSGLFLTLGDIHGVTMDFDSADPEGFADGGNFGMNGSFTVIHGNVLIKGTTNSGSSDTAGLYIEGTVTVEDTASIELIGSSIQGNVSLQAGASMDLINTFIDGDITLASGAGTALLTLGNYSGDLIDPDRKFNRDTGDLINVKLKQAKLA